MGYKRLLLLIAAAGLMALTPLARAEAHGYYCRR
jgi:hypothetical protein